MGYTNLCRVCESAEDLEMIFKEESTKIVHMLRHFTPNPIYINDGLPQYVCPACAQQLRNAYNFKSMYEYSTERLLHEQGIPLVKALSRTNCHKMEQMEIVKTENVANGPSAVKSSETEEDMQEVYIVAAESDTFDSSISIKEESHEIVSGLRRSTDDQQMNSSNGWSIDGWCIEEVAEPNCSGLNTLPKEKVGLRYEKNTQDIEQQNLANKDGSDDDYVEVYVISEPDPEKERIKCTKCGKKFTDKSGSRKQSSVGRENVCDKCAKPKKPKSRMTLIDLAGIFTHDKLDHTSVSKLQSWGVIPLEFPCPKCKKLMSLEHDTSKPDNFRWKCRKNIRKTPPGCYYSRSLRQGTYFALSKLPVAEQVYHTYCWIQNIHEDYTDECLDIFSNTVAALRQRCYEVIVMGLIRHTEKIGGNGKFVQIIDSKFGQRKYQRKGLDKCQWVFGGMEWGSGKSFFVPVSVGSKNEVLHIIKEFIMPESTLISNCLRTHKCSNKEFIDLKISKSLQFLDPISDSATIKEERRRFKAFFPMRGIIRKEFDVGDLAKTMFLKRSISKGTDPLIDFMKWAGELFDPKGQE